MVHVDNTDSSDPVVMMSKTDTLQNVANSLKVWLLFYIPMTDFEVSQICLLVSLPVKMEEMALELWRGRFIVNLTQDCINLYNAIQMSV